MKPIIITVEEFQNLITGARLLDYHSPRMEVERFTLEQWLVCPDVVDQKKAHLLYVPPLLRHAENLGSLRFEEIRKAGGIQ